MRSVFFKYPSGTKGSFGYLGVDHKFRKDEKKVWDALHARLSKEDRAYEETLTNYMYWTNIGVITPDSLPILIERFDFLVRLDYIDEDERLTEELLNRFLGYSIAYFEFLTTTQWLDKVLSYAGLKDLPYSCKSQNSHDYLDSLMLASIKPLDLPRFINYEWHTKKGAQQYKRRLAQGV